jgi:hypothetical protein
MHVRTWSRLALIAASSVRSRAMLSEGTSRLVASSDAIDCTIDKIIKYNIKKKKRNETKKKKT